MSVDGAMHTTIVLFREIENARQYRLVLGESVIPEIEARGSDRLNKEMWYLTAECNYSELYVVSRALEFLAHRDYLPLVRNVVILALSPGVTQIDLGLMEAE